VVGCGEGRARRPQACNGLRDFIRGTCSSGEAHRPEPPVTAWAALELLLLELTEEDEGLSVAESVGAVVAAAFAVEPLLLVAVDVLVVLEVDGFVAAAAVPGWA
jgi:hypothetical protein